MKRQSVILLFVLASAAISLSAAPMTFSAHLSGPAEFPANASPGTGLSFVTIDPDAHTMSVSVDFSGLIGLTTAAHIHIVAPPNPTGPVATTVPTFPGFPLGVMAGNYERIFDTLEEGTYNPMFLNNMMNMGNVAAAEATLFAAIQDGNAYLNIHSDEYQAGEIRGFLAPVPEPATLALAAAALAALAGIRRTRSVE